MLDEQPTMPARLTSALQRFAQHYNEIHGDLEVKETHTLIEIEIDLDAGCQHRPFLRTLAEYAVNSTEVSDEKITCFDQTERTLSVAEAKALAEELNIASGDEWYPTHRTVERMYFFIPYDSVQPLLQRMQQDIADPSAAQQRLADEERREKLDDAKDAILNRLGALDLTPAEKIGVLREVLHKVQPQLAQTELKG